MRPRAISGSLCPLRLVLGTFFHHFPLISAPFSLIFTAFSVEFVAPPPSKNKIRERSAQGDHPKKQFLQSTNHI